jgi:hypothetical protein
VRFYLLSDSRRALIVWRIHPDWYVPDDHIPLIPYCSISERSICPVSRTRYHDMDIGTSFDQYMSQSQYSAPHRSHSPIRELWWIITICTHDRCRYTPLNLSAYGIQATESLRYTPREEACHLLKKIPFEFERDFAIHRCAQ